MSGNDAILIGGDWSDMDCKANDWIEHAAFGLGRVSENRGDRLDIEFVNSGAKTGRAT